MKIETLECKDKWRKLCNSCLQDLYVKGKLSQPQPVDTILPYLNRPLGIIKKIALNYHQDNRGVNKLLRDDVTEWQKWEKILKRVAQRKWPQGKKGGLIDHQVEILVKNTMLAASSELPKFDFRVTLSIWFLKILRDCKNKKTKPINSKQKNIVSSKDTWYPSPELKTLALCILNKLIKNEQLPSNNVGILRTNILPYLRWVEEKVETITLNYYKHGKTIHLLIQGDKKACASLSKEFEIYACKEYSFFLSRRKDLQPQDLASVVWEGLWLNGGLKSFNFESSFKAYWVTILRHWVWEEIRKEAVELAVSNGVDPTCENATTKMPILQSINSTGDNGTDKLPWTVVDDVTPQVILEMGEELAQIEQKRKQLLDVANQLVIHEIERICQGQREIERNLEIGIRILGCDDPAEYLALAQKINVTKNVLMIVVSRIRKDMEANFINNISEVFHKGIKQKLIEEEEAQNCLRRILGPHV